MLPEVGVNAPILRQLAAIPLLRLARLGEGACWAVAATAAVALVLGFPQAGINLTALHSPAPVPPGAIRVTLWDTLGWDQGKNAGRFYRYLIAQHADLYLLQEYMGTRGGQPWPINESARLHRTFPGYHIAVAGELLTLSRFPIMGQRYLRAALPSPDTSWAAYWDIRVLRTDLRIGATTLSAYNVHMPDLFSTADNPLSPSFYGVVHELYVRREAELTALHADLAHNRHPSLVGGEFNVLPGTGDLRRLGELADAAHASQSLYPVSFWVGFLQAWRLDWTLVSPGVRVDRYLLADPQGLSTHRAQDVVISLGRDT